MQTRAHAHGPPYVSSIPLHRHRAGSGYTAMAGLERIRAARRRVALGRRRVWPLDEDGHEDGRTTKSPMRTWLTSLTSPCRWFGDPYLRRPCCPLLRVLSQVAECRRPGGSSGKPYWHAAHGVRCCVLHAACRRMPLPIAAARMSVLTWLESRPEQVLDTRIASTALAPSATRAHWPTARSAT